MQWIQSLERNNQGSGRKGDEPTDWQRQLRMKFVDFEEVMVHIIHVQNPAAKLMSLSH